VPFLVTFHHVQRLVDDLKKERETVEEEMAMAEDELQKTEDLLGMLSDSKTVRDKTSRRPRCCVLPAMLAPFSIVAFDLHADLLTSPMLSDRQTIIDQYINKCK